MTTTYLVTGGAGFIGSHLSDALVARGDHVVALDDLSTGQLSNVDDLINGPSFRFLNASVLDPEAIDEAVRGVDIVVHLAAAVGVKLIVEHPLRSLTTNIRGSEIVLEAAHRYGRKVMIASTSEIYGKAGGPLAETSDRVIGSTSVPRWAYSTAKAVDEILAFAYHKERGLPTVIARLFNTVGPRQSAEYGMVIPRLVQQALRSEPMTVFGDGTQTRCFCHVEDVVRALLLLLDDQRAEGDVFNVGSTHEISILALAEMIKELAGSTSDIRLIPYNEAYESGFEDMQRRVPDVSKLAGMTNWAPRYGLREILDDTIAVHRSQLPIAG